jgi:hypothetical protein
MSEANETTGAVDGGTPPVARDLSAALRSARMQQAERSDVIVDLRAAEIARLELLRDDIAAVMRQVPAEHASLFDGGLIPGYPPRLWIDILTFVEMARDKRTYRFQRDTREGRMTLHETADAREMADKITTYVAHRIIERERALAENGTSVPLGPPAAPGMPVRAPEKPAGKLRAKLVVGAADATWGRGPSPTPTEAAPVPERAPDKPPEAAKPVDPRLAQPAWGLPVANTGENRPEPLWGRPPLSNPPAMTVSAGRKLDGFLLFGGGVLTGAVVVALAIWFTLGAG